MSDKMGGNYCSWSWVVIESMLISSTCAQGNNTAASTTGAIVGGTISATVIAIVGIVITIAIFILTPCYKKIWDKKDRNDRPSHQNRGTDLPDSGGGNGAMASDSTVVLLEQESRPSQFGTSEARLCEDLQPLAAKWKSLGIQLEVPKDELDAIEVAQSCTERLEEIINVWLHNGEVHTKEKLVKVLETKAVGENNLAHRISSDRGVPDSFDEEKEKSMRSICDKLSDVAHKYSAIGIQLLGTLDAVKKIEVRVKDVKGYLSEMIANWLKVVYKGNQPCTEILKAIRSKTVNNGALANKLEKEWKEKGFLPEPPAAANAAPPAANTGTSARVPEANQLLSQAARDREARHQT